jgi:exportin-2 (importin alpha re-exporter)
MGLRESDEEAFEDDPIEYIRRDLEGSGILLHLFIPTDTDTRRRSASDLVRGLVEHFAQQVTVIFGGYVSKFLEEYAKDPVNNWKLKDTALYLVISLSARGVLPQTGAVSLNEFVPLLPIYQSNIVPELQAATAAGNPIVKVDCIKFLVRSLFIVIP